MSVRHNRSARLCAVLAGGAALLLGVTGGWAKQGPATTDDELRRYAETPATDPLGALQKRIDQGGAELKYAEPRGYLDSLLRLLDVPASSQVLVYSKTSLQIEGISARGPRAIFFNDDVYVGWVKEGELLELSASDPQLGAVFYVLPQREEGPNRIVRVSKQCMECHYGKLTGGVPGHIMRSVRVGADGKPDPAAPTYLTTDRSPFEQRWGGWYVSGTHGEASHRGNGGAPGAANVTDLRGLFDTTNYLSPHSDIVALMVLAHQTHVHNLLTRAGYETRAALRDEQQVKDAVGASAETSGMTRRRIEAAAEPLVRALLFCGEAKLTGPVRGTTYFAADFARRGPRDTRGRSLRDLDLQTRLLRYPCSYLIYSRAFDALPAPARDYVYRRLREVLEGRDATPEFSHLSPADRKAIIEILTETKPGFAGR